MLCKYEAVACHSWVVEMRRRREGRVRVSRWMLTLPFAIAVSFPGTIACLLGCLVLTVAAITRAVGVVARRVRGARQARALDFGHGRCVV